MLPVAPDSTPTPCALQGNDQVRFELTCYSLAPQIKVRPCSSPGWEWQGGALRDARQGGVWRFALDQGCPHPTPQPCPPPRFSQWLWVLRYAVSGFLQRPSLGGCDGLREGVCPVGAQPGVRGRGPDGQLTVANPAARPCPASTLPAPWGPAYLPIDWGYSWGSILDPLWPAGPKWSEHGFWQTGTFSSTFWGCRGRMGVRRASPLGPTAPLHDLHGQRT